MKVLSGIVILTALVACSAGPLGDDFSTSDENGGYHFGFNDGRLARQEERSPEGIVRGAYSYVDANGQTQTITYTADSHNGFLASGSSIPQPTEVEPVTPEVVLPAVVEDTPEVKAARAEHLEAHKKVQSGPVQEVVVPASLPLQYSSQIPAGRAPIFYAVNQGLIGNSGYFPITYANQPRVQYVIQSSPYHPDYLPYAGL